MNKRAFFHIQNINKRTNTDSALKLYYITELIIGEITYIDIKDEIVTQKILQPHLNVA